jgi:hypothetical protein
VLHTYGTLDDDLPKERFRELLEALPTIDAEHGVVTVTHNETGLTVDAPHRCQTPLRRWTSSHRGRGV